MFTPETVAWHLDDAGIPGVTYEPDADSGSVFVVALPDYPDNLVTVAPLGGTRLEWAAEQVSEVQVRVRGEKGTEYSTWERAQAVADALQAGGPGEPWPTVWAADEPCETVIVSATSTPPAAMGYDEHGRPEYVIRLTVRHAVDG